MADHGRSEGDALLPVDGDLRRAQPQHFSKLALGAGFLCTVLCAGAGAAFYRSPAVHPNPGRTASVGAANHRSTLEVDLKPGWVPEHVKQMCANAKAPSARRLKGAGEPEPFELRLFRKHEMPYYGSTDLDADVPNRAEQAILFMHGAARNAQDYFCALRDIVDTAVSGGERDKNHIFRKLEDYIIIAPKYHYTVDVKKHHEEEKDVLYWNGSKPFGDWRGGAAADEKLHSHQNKTFEETYNSFSVIDDFLLRLGDQTKFPNMKRIVLAGHSAGAQAVQRYALVTHLRPPSMASEEALKEMKALRPGVDVRYVVANPSSFAYMNTKRWSYSWKGESEFWGDMTYQEYQPTLGRRGWDAQGGRRRTQTTPRKWGPLSKGYEELSAKKPFICRDSRFNDWGYGLNWTNPDFGDLIPYLMAHPALHRAAEFYGARDVIYLVGQNDTCSDDMFGSRSICMSSCWSKNNEKSPCTKTAMDVRCPAMLQGPNRNARARNYMKHLAEHFGKPVHRFYEVPGLGHQAQEIFKSEIGQKAMFESLADQLPGTGLSL